MVYKLNVCWDINADSTFRRAEYRASLGPTASDLKIIYEWLLVLHPIYNIRDLGSSQQFHIIISLYATGKEDKKIEYIASLAHETLEPRNEHP